jgi:LysM repeat protein
VSIYRGETISDIAEYCDVPVVSLVRANNIRNVRNVASGQQLHIPSVRGEVYEGSYRYAYQDERYRDASYRDDYIPASWVEDYQGRESYRIRRGDTLAEIAWRFDVPLRTLFQLNPGVHPRELQVGERIYLPEYSRTSPRDRERRDYVYYQDEPPLISISPARGPRDGKIRVIGDNFRQGEKVTVYFGDSRDKLTQLRIVETDGDGRINELVTLPENYNNNQAYIALRAPHYDDYVMSEAYAIEGLGGPNQNYSSTYDRNDSAVFGNPTIRASQSSVYWGDKITLHAEGFPANTPVAIYGGPNRNSLEKISEVRTGPRGEFSTDVDAPESSRRGSIVFVAAIEDGPRTIVSDQIRVLDRNDDQYGRYDGASLSDDYLDRNSSVTTDRYNYREHQAAITPTSLDRGVGNKGGIFNRFRSNDAYVGDRASGHAGGIPPSGSSSSIVGVLTNEGEQCRALRDDSGNLFTLLGDLGGFDDGDRVLIQGVRADNRICGQAATVQVYSIDTAPW